jgi:hypothetical protein
VLEKPIKFNQGDLCKIRKKYRNEIVYLYNPTDGTKSVSYKYVAYDISYLLFLFSENPVIKICVAFFKDGNTFLVMMAEQEIEPC